MRSQKKQLIMIADQDDDERGLLRSILKLKGFRVLEAVDGRDVINLARVDSPDLFIVNLTLPRVAEAIRRVRTHVHLRHLPLITFCSRRPTSWEKQLAAQSTRHFDKSFELDEFCKLVEGLLANRNSAAA